VWNYIFLITILKHIKLPACYSESLYCYDVDTCVCAYRSDHFWLRVRNLVSWRFSETFGMNILTIYPKSKAPYNVTIYKGSNQAALTRAFVLYFLYRYLLSSYIQVYIRVFIYILQR